MEGFSEDDRRRTAEPRILPYSETVASLDFMMGMDDERDCSPYQQQQQLVSLSKDNLLLLDRKALQASVKARYRDGQATLDSPCTDELETESKRLEGDKEGTFAVASLKSSAGRANAPTATPAARVKQRRIKVIKHDDDNDIVRSIIV